MTTAIIMEPSELEVQIEKIIERVLSRREMKPLLTANDVCALAKISKITLWKHMTAGRLTPVPRKNSKSNLFFTSEEIERYLSTNPKYSRSWEIQ